VDVVTGATRAFRALERFFPARDRTLRDDAILRRGLERCEQPFGQNPAIGRSFCVRRRSKH
jgi:hypothetical protein